MRRSLGDEEEGVIGWVSMTDLFLLTTVLMLAVTAFVQATFEQSEQEKRSELTPKEVQALRETIDRLERRREELEEKVAAQKETIEELREKIAKLEKQLEARERKLAELRRRLEKLEAENRRLADRVAEIEKQRDRLRETLEEKNELLAKKNRLIEKQKRMLEQKQRLLEKYRRRARKLAAQLADLKEGLLRTPDEAELVVKISADLPENLDLDLFVQDPKDRLTFYRNREIWTENRQVATLILSEYLKRTLEGQIEEVFYSANMIPSPGGAEEMYLVYCILRDRGGGKPRRLDEPMTVEWEIWLKDRGGDRIAGETYGGKLNIPATGWARGGGEDKLRFFNLYRIAGFYKRAADDRKLTVHGPEHDAVPSTPRGFVELKEVDQSGPDDVRLD